MCHCMSSGPPSEEEFKISNHKAGGRDFDCSLSRNLLSPVRRLIADCDGTLYLYLIAWTHTRSDSIGSIIPCVVGSQPASYTLLVEKKTYL